MKLKKYINGKTILITGGTGSFGRLFVQTVLGDFSPRKVIVFSRDELKQYDMGRKINDPRVRFFLGDVRDYSRLTMAFQQVDAVVHAAALKQVPACEYNPFEAVKTNILGAQNVIQAAIKCGVKKVVALSTDKAVNPLNLYGATKLVHEKLFINGNAYVGPHSTRMSVVRYGNVVGSRGSVVPLFIEQRQQGVLTLTHRDMTRFWISLEAGVRFVLQAMEEMHGGEIYVPKLPSMRIVDLAKAVAPKAKISVIGIRPGEKVHELLVNKDEARRAVAIGNSYIILPDGGAVPRYFVPRGVRLAEDFEYSSEKNTEWIGMSALKKMIQPFLLANKVF